MPPILNRLIFKAAESAYIIRPYSKSFPFTSVKPEASSILIYIHCSVNFRFTV